MPSGDDVDAGVPFSGKSGHWLKNQWLGYTGLTSEQVMFDNTIRCHPPTKKKGSSPYPTNSKKKEDRTNAESHCAAYSVWSSVPLSVPLLAVGSEAASNLLGVDNLTKWHGHISYNAEGRLTGVTYHPNSVRKEPNLFPLVVRETQNLLDAAANPSTLLAPKVNKGYIPYVASETVIDLEWEYDYATGRSGRTTIVGSSNDSSHGSSTYNVDQGLEVVRQHFEAGNRIIGHNIISADLPRLGSFPLSLGPDHIVDTKIIAHLLHAHWAELGLYSLDDLCKFYFPTTGWKHDKLDALEYNGRDCAQNFKLWEAMKIDLTLTDQWHLIERQQRLARMTYLMHQKGIRIDSSAIREFNMKWKQNRIAFKAQMPFNPDSPLQVKKWMHENKFKCTGTDYDSIAKYRGKHPIVDQLLQYKDEGKGLKSWYSDEAIELGRIYSEFNVTGTMVDRFSSSSPNTQNIPPWAKFAILPDNEEEYIYNADAKNLEGRTVAWHAGDTQMLNDFRAGTDTHKVVASRIFNKRVDEVSKEERQVGKTVVHASNYLEGEYNLARRLYGNVQHDSIRKARIAQQAYFKAYSATRTWQESVTKQLDSGNIMLSNAFGRKRFIYGSDSHERAKRGCHFLGCSTGADIVNQKALDIWDATGLLPIMVVHDSHVYSLPKGEAGLKLEQQIKEIQHLPVKELNGEVEVPWEASRGPNYKDLTEIQ
jgi:DNA polymerase I-like protein with 3'-5' exonuclease and polymerase domains/uracil-DNA glycosylase